MRYGIYKLEVIHAAIQMAKEEGVFVSLDLASFEVWLYEFLCMWLKEGLPFGFLHCDKQNEIITKMLMKKKEGNGAS